MTSRARLATFRSGEGRRKAFVVGQSFRQSCEKLAAVSRRQNTVITLT